MIDEDSQRAEEGDKSLRFAKTFDVNITPKDYGVWSEIDGFRVWRLNVKSFDAYSIMVDFENLEIPNDGRLFLYNKDRSTIIGPITEQYISNSNKFFSPLVSGDFITIEYVESNERSSQNFKISGISHDYRDIFKSFQNPLDYDEEPVLECHNDVNCPVGADWQTEKKAVARIVYEKDGNKGACTGTLLNNTSSKTTPYFLTANHCISTEDEANSSVVYFNFERDCNSGSGKKDYYVCGTQLKATSSYTDFTLLELNSRVPSSFEPLYAGWSRYGDERESVTVIHHPKANVKKISFDTDEVNSNFEEIIDPNTGDVIYSSNTVWVVDYDNGTTEFGSSGAPLFDENDIDNGEIPRVIGQLSSGGVGCEITDYFGMFSVSWNTGVTPETRLKDWLDPTGSNAYTIKGIATQGWLHTEIDPNASNNDKIYTKLKSIVVGAGNQVFYRGDNNHVQSYYWDATINAFAHGNLGNSSSPNSHKIKGDIVVGHGNQVFYRGNDGHVHTYYWFNNTWNHAKLGGSSPPSSHRVRDKEGTISINKVTNQIFYRGVDDRLQTYYWTGSNWQHDFLGGSSAPSGHDADGDVEFDPNPNSNERVVYRGVDGKIHTYELISGSWVHSSMSPNHQVSTAAGSIVVGETGQIFFRGTDNRMQTFYLASANNWVHAWLGWQNEAKIAGDIAIGKNNKLFFKGSIDGKMHTWQWNGSSWGHDWLEASWQAPNVHDVNGSIAVGEPITLNNSRPIFYRGIDNRMRRYHWEGSFLKSTKSHDGYYSMNETVLSKTIPNVDYNNNLLSMTVRPNPVVDIFTLDVYTQSESEAQIFLYDSMGRLVLEKIQGVNEGANNIQLNISHLNTGVYYLNIIDENGGKLTKSIIKM